MINIPDTEKTQTYTTDSYPFLDGLNLPEYFGLKHTRLIKTFDADTGETLGYTGIIFDASGITWDIYPPTLDGIRNLLDLISDMYLNFYCAMDDRETQTETTNPNEAEKTK